MHNSELIKPIFLCGMMGSGKSTVGRELAKKLNVPFLDLDHLIEKKEQMTIPEIFKQKGESAFRITEKELLANYSQTAKGVLALGGGALQDQRTVNHLKSLGWLVFLDCPRSVLFERLNNSKNRPMLSTDEDLKNRISHLLEKRLPFYRQAQFIIHTARLTEDEVANEIVKNISMNEK